MEQMEGFVEITNEKADGNTVRGRRLEARKEVFVIDEGTYQGVITEAFWHCGEGEQERVMLGIQLDNGITFKTSVNGEWIDAYPFSVLISQANIAFVEDFINCRVEFQVRNRSCGELEYSNIRKIRLLAEK